METINHEYYVSLEVAKLLEEAGFDWECRECYPSNFMTCQYEEYAKPTLDVAQRWLREVKGYYIEIVIYENKRCVTNSDGWTFHYEYDKPTFDCEIKNERGETIYMFNETYNTYEKAQEVGEKKALELILKKGE